MIYGDGPIDGSVGFGCRFRVNRINGFRGANHGGRKVRASLQTVAAQAFATNELVLGLALHRLLADEAALAVIAGMATAGAKCLARVRYRRRQLRTAACRGFSSTNSTIIFPLKNQVYGITLAKSVRRPSIKRAFSEADLGVRNNGCFSARFDHCAGRIPQEGATKVPVHPWSPRSPNRRDSCNYLGSIHVVSSAMTITLPALRPQPGGSIRPAGIVAGRARSG
jgi:hypothetical protein